MDKSGKILLVSTCLALIAFGALADGAEIEEGNFFDLVDKDNSSIILGQNYTFDNVTVYGDAVEFNNSSNVNNLSIYSEPLSDINTTLKEYKLNNPEDVQDGGEVFRVETGKNSSLKNFTYEVDAEKLDSGEYKIYNGSDSLIQTFTGSSTATWKSEDTSTNSSFYITYTGNRVELEWKSQSDNEDSFVVYSNASGDYPSLDNYEVQVGSAPKGTNQTATHTGEDVQGGTLTSGEEVCYRVRAENQYGYSEKTAEDCIVIP